MALIASSPLVSHAPSTGFANFNGLKSSVPAAPISSGKKLMQRLARSAVSASANSSSEGVNTAEPSMFASISQAPTSTVPTKFVLPSLVGAGLVGAAAVAFFQGPSTTPSTPSPPSENGAVAVIPSSKKAAPAALATMAAVFPNAMQEESFMKAIAAELFNLGFRRDNCISLVNTCRDEVCRPLVNLVDREFGLSFNISGLGGLVNCGKTGFKAAMSHSPEFPCDVEGTPRERYIFFAFPHVSVGESGEVGSLLRRGRGKPSSACGALIAIKNDISGGGAVTEDVDDAEYVLLKKKVMSKIPRSDVEGPSLVQVTKAALQAITNDLETLISLTVDPATADYAVITGVQIHSGAQVPGEPFKLERTCDYIAPNAMYAVIRGEKHILHCEVNQITAIKSVPVAQFASS